MKPATVPPTNNVPFGKISQTPFKNSSKPPNFS